MIRMNHIEHRHAALGLPNIAAGAPFRADLDLRSIPKFYGAGVTDLLVTMPPIPHMGGFLRSLHVSICTWGPAGPKTIPADRPRHAADRTRSRRARAGSRRTKRYGLNPKGPAMTGWSTLPDDGPWNPIVVTKP